MFRPAWPPELTNVKSDNAAVRMFWSSLIQKFVFGLKNDDQAQANSLLKGQVMNNNKQKVGDHPNPTLLDYIDCLRHMRRQQTGRS